MTVGEVEYMNDREKVYHNSKSRICAKKKKHECRSVLATVYPLGILMKKISRYGNLLAIPPCLSGSSSIIRLPPIHLTKQA